MAIHRQMFLFQALLLCLGFSFSPVQAQPELGIVGGKIQDQANCILCGGRFLCGATSETVKLQYSRTSLQQPIKAHCAKKSREIAESLRLNQRARSEEELRYQRFHENYLLPIDANKGGRLTYKEEQGFAYEDFVLYLSATKKLPPDARKAAEQSNRLKRTRLEEDHVLLPVLSELQFKETFGSSLPVGRVSEEYRQYVIDLITTHPSYLYYPKKGGALVRRGEKSDDFLLARLKHRFAVDETARAPASIDGKESSQPNSIVSQTMLAPQAVGGSSGGSVVGGSSSSSSNSGPGQERRLDHNGRDVAAELRMKEEKQQALQQRELEHQKDIEIQRREKAGYRASQLSEFVSAPIKYRYAQTPGYEQSVKRIMSGELCRQGVHNNTPNYVQSSVNDLVATHGAADEITRVKQQQELTNNLLNAMQANQCDKAEEQVVRVFHQLSDPITAQNTYSAMMDQMLNGKNRINYNRFKPTSVATTRSRSQRSDTSRVPASMNESTDSGVGEDSFPSDSAIVIATNNAKNFPAAGISTLGNTESEIQMSKKKHSDCRANWREWLDKQRENVKDCSIVELCTEHIGDLLRQKCNSIRKVLHLASGNCNTLVNKERADKFNFRSQYSPERNESLSMAKSVNPKPLSDLAQYRGLRKYSQKEITAAELALESVFGVRKDSPPELSKSTCDRLRTIAELTANSQVTILSEQEQIALKFLFYHPSDDEQSQAYRRRLAHLINRVKGNDCLALGRKIQEIAKKASWAASNDAEIQAEELLRQWVQEQIPKGKLTPENKQKAIDLFAELYELGSFANLAGENNYSEDLRENFHLSQRRCAPQRSNETSSVSKR